MQAFVVDKGKNVSSHDAIGMISILQVISPTFLCAYYRSTKQLVGYCFSHVVRDETVALAIIENDLLASSKDISTQKSCCRCGYHT